MTTLVRFEGDRGWLEFRLERYEFKRASDYWDGNWIVGSIRSSLLEANPGRSELPVYFRTNELAQLAQDLQEFLTGDSQKVETSHIEGQFGQVFERAGDRIMWSFWFDDQRDSKFVAEPTKMSRENADSSLAALEAVIRNYPIRGESFG